MTFLTIVVLSGLVLFANGCNRTNVIPERLEGKVDRDLRYADMKHNPESYKGKLMLAGGKVLSAERLKDGTKIELLQIPLSKDLIPAGREADSKGRFVVIDRNNQVSDPAIFNNDKRITVVGEVLGTTTVKVDEVQLEVPQLALEHITVWEADRVRGGYWPQYGYGYPSRWGTYGYFGYPYYW